MIKRIGIVTKPDPDPQRIQAAISPLISWLKGNSLSYILTTDAASFSTGEHPHLPVEELIKQVDLIVALGGDGTLLSIARLTAPLTLPILAVNLGGLGFITEVKVEEMIPTLQLVIAGKYRKEKRMMLEVTQTEQCGTESSCIGLNEVAINKTDISRLIDLDVYVDDLYVTSYAADGLIVATPTGSTAYSLSAGGPIVHPSMNAFIITPICPHTLTNRPVIVDSGRVIKVINASESKTVNLTIDGQLPFTLGAKGEIKVRKSKHFLTLVVSPQTDYFAILREKLRWSGRP